MESIQVGDGSRGRGDFDSQGLRDGLWTWDNPMTYIRKIKMKRGPGAFVDSEKDYHTIIRMMVWYQHGRITKAVLDYDITDVALKTWEEGRAVSDSEESGYGYPFKQGIWRAYHGESGRLFSIRCYEGAAIRWRYQKEKEDDLLWTFQKAVVVDGMFSKWGVGIGVVEDRLPPENVWENWNDLPGKYSLPSAK